MEEKRDSWVMYRSFVEAGRFLTDEQRWKYYTLIFDHMFEFTIWQSDDPVVNAMFMIISPQIQANIRKYKNWKEPKVKQHESKTEAKQKQSKSKTEGNVNDNVNVYDNDNKNDNKKNKSVLFSEFISQYPNKDWRSKAEEKYPIKEHEKIMIWLERQKKKRDYLATMWEFVPSRPMVSTRINQKRRLDIEDDTEINNIKLPATDIEKAHLYVKIGRAKYKELFWIDETAYANQQRNIYLVD